MTVLGRGLDGKLQASLLATWACLQIHAFGNGRRNPRRTARPDWGGIVIVFGLTVW